MSSLVWLVRKDLKVFFADRQGALMTVLVPVVLASLLGMLFAPRASASVLHLLVVSSDAEPLVTKLVTAIDASENFEVERVSEAVARERVAKGRASLALILPPGTAESLRPENLFQGERRRVELLYDPSNEIEANMARGLLIQVSMQETMASLADPQAMATSFESWERRLAPDTDPALREFVRAGRGLKERAKPEPSAGKASAGGGLSPPLEFEKVAVAASGGARGYNSYAHNFAGMLLMFLLFAAQSRAKALIGEREAGTLVRLRLTGASHTRILLGVGASTALIALLASTLVYAVGMLVFGIRIQGPLAGFVGVVLAQALFVGGFALLLAGLGRTEEQVGAIGPFVVLVMCFAGGAMFPSFMMPSWLRTLSLVLPTYWATDGLAAMTWRGLGLSSAALPIAFLLAWASLSAIIGIRRFRSRA